MHPVAGNQVVHGDRPAATCLLGGVQGGVSATQQGRNVCCLAGPADAQRQLLAADQQLAQVGHPRSDRGGLPQVDVDEQRDELIPAEAGEQVLGANRSPHLGRHGLQRSVPGEVAVHVVDSPAMVDVDHHRGAPAAVVPGQHTLGLVQEVAAAVEPGQGVGHRPLPVADSEVLVFGDGDELAGDDDDSDQVNPSFVDR